MNVLINIPDNDIPDKGQEFVDLSIHFMNKQVCEVDGYGFQTFSDSQKLVDSGELLKRISEKASKLSNLDTINGLCGAVAIIYDLLIESGQESEE